MFGGMIGSRAQHGSRRHDIPYGVVGEGSFAHRRPREVNVRRLGSTGFPGFILGVPPLHLGGYLLNDIQHFVGADIWIGKSTDRNHEITGRISTAVRLRAAHRLAGCLDQTNIQTLDEE